MNDSHSYPSDSAESHAQPVTDEQNITTAYSLRTFSVWDTAKRFLACNPFYLVSAALLLYSFYLISADSTFLAKESQQLSFNLCSLELYEILLVGTAIFLAWRAVWYDSTLLVGLENLFVLIPFILISQAALIDEKLVWALSSVAGLLAVFRLNLLKRLIARLNFPPILLFVGIGLIVVNGALPIVYRILHESKFGTKPDWGAAYETNQYIWWLLAPFLCALINLVPFSRKKPDGSWPDLAWLPIGLSSLWLLGTGVHLYCLGYVYDFALRPELVAPAVWVLCWTLAFRASLVLPEMPPLWKGCLLVFPLIATFLAVPQVEKGVFLVLSILNVAIYSRRFIRERMTAELHLALISCVALLGGLPASWTHAIAPRLSPAIFVVAAAVVYLLGCIASSRNPKLGTLGAVLASIAVGKFLEQSDAAHWAFQTGLVFLVLHSLRWEDDSEPGAKGVRWVIAAIWVGHAFAWAHLYDGGWKPCIPAATVILVCAVARFMTGEWAPRAVLVAGCLVCLSAPGHSATVHLASAPAGLLAALGSFLLFALGTLGALTKHRWHPSVSK